MVSEKVSAKRLKIPLSRAPPPNDPGVEGFVLDEIIKAIDEAESDIAILVDACVLRHDVQDEVRDLVTTTRFPVYSAPMGKTAVSEEYDRYGGVRLRCSCPIPRSSLVTEDLHRISQSSYDQGRRRKGQADTVYWRTEIGFQHWNVHISNSDHSRHRGMYAFVLELSEILSQFQLHSDHTLVRHAHFPGIGMKLLLPKLTARLRTYQHRASELSIPRPTVEIPVEHHNDITQAYFWPRISKFFKTKDVIVTETGA